MNEPREVSSERITELQVEFNLGAQLSSAVSEILNRYQLDGDDGKRRPGINRPVQVFTEAGYRMPKSEYMKIKPANMQQAEKFLERLCHPIGRSERRVGLLPEIDIQRDHLGNIHLAVTAIRTEILRDFLDVIYNIHPAMIANGAATSPVLRGVVPSRQVKSSWDVQMMIEDKLEQISNGKNADRLMTVGNFALALSYVRRPITSSL